MIGASISPDSSGAFLVETKLSQPISLEGNDVLTRIASELPPDRLFPTGLMGGAGMLIPAQYSGGELISTYTPGQSIDLAAAIDSFGRQLNGETVSEPYIFSPNTRRFLVDANSNALIGWQTIMFAPPAFGDVGTFSVSMQDNGDSPVFSDGVATMGGWWDTIYSGGARVANFFTGDAPLWQKVGVGAAAVVAGLLCAKAVVAATGIAVLGKIAAWLGIAVGGYVGISAATGMNAVSSELGQGWKIRADGGGMPDSLLGKVGYSMKAVSDGAARAQQMLKNFNEDAKRQLQAMNDRVDRLVNQFGSWFEKLKPWLLGAILLGGGYAAYNVWGKNR